MIKSEKLYRSRKSCLAFKNYQQWEVLNKVVEELKEKEEDKLAEKFIGLWEEEKRLPQELITFEVMKKYFA